MKPPRACWPCRQSKRKCSRRGFGEPCVPCQQRHLQCGLELIGARDGANRRSVEQSSLLTLAQAAGRESESTSFEDQARAYRHSSRHGAGLPKHLATQLVDLYLEEVHDRTQSIFHAATLRAKVDDESISSALLYAICAMGSKFWTEPEERNLELRFTEAAKSLLLADLENICVENTQTCLILANLSAGNARVQSQALYLRE